VTVEDPQARVLAFSNLGHEIDEARRETILGRGVSEGVMARLDDAGILDATAQAAPTSCASTATTPGASRRGWPRRCAREPSCSARSGSPQSESPLDEDAEEAPGARAQVAAIHLVYHRASDDLKRRTRAPSCARCSTATCRTRQRPTRRCARPARSPCSCSPSAAASRVRTASTPTAFLSRRQPVLRGRPPRRDVRGFINDRFLGAAADPRRAAFAPRTTSPSVSSSASRASWASLLAGIGGPVSRIGDRAPVAPRRRAGAHGASARRGGAVRVADIEEVRAHAVLLDLLRLAEEHPNLLAGKVADLVAARRRARH